MITAEKLATAIGCRRSSTIKWFQPLIDAMEKFGIIEVKHQAAFIAQVAHESALFTVVEENLNYSADRLMAIFKHKYYGNPALASVQARKPQMIANFVYANKNGNGDGASGDGWRFRGRGLIQITGKDNYIACGSALGIDLVQDPDLLLTTDYGALSAAWFWSSHNLNKLADDGNVADETKVVNGGTNGLADRQALYNAAIVAFSEV